MGAVDALWVCGDTVGYGPDPSDVIALLAERKATLVAGNHDRAVATGEDLDLFNPPAAVAARMSAPPAAVTTAGVLRLFQMLMCFSLSVRRG
jgi:hypothetical protein